LQAHPLRPVANHDLGARQVEIEECFEVLLHREPPDGKEYRPREAEVDRARAKQLCIDPARPQAHIRKAAFGELLRQRRRRRHHRA
jgi:hypothetical protein